VRAKERQGKKASKKKRNDGPADPECNAIGAKVVRDRVEKGLDVRQAPVLVT
jgi:hypothetical protein